MINLNLNLFFSLKNPILIFFVEIELFHIYSYCNHINSIRPLFLTSSLSYIKHFENEYKEQRKKAEILTDSDLNVETEEMDHEESDSMATDK